MQECTTMYLMFLSHYCKYFKHDDGKCFSNALNDFSEHHTGVIDKEVLGPLCTILNTVKLRHWSIFKTY